MSKQTFLKATFVLIIAGLITRILGFVNRIVVARLIGEEGVGLYMMALPTYVLTITLTQLGLPVAISKLVAEAEAVGDKRKIKKILVVSLLTTGLLSLIFTPGMIMFAPLLSETLFTDPRTYYPLVAIAPIVPIVALSSILRGYFQGLQNMKPAAISQVIEQVVRITLVYLFTNALLPYGIEFAAAGAMFSAIAGELASLVYMIWMFKTKKRITIHKDFLKAAKASKQTLNDLMRIALPTTGSRLIGSLSWFFEPIVVANSLAIAGVAEQIATKQYGEVTGFAMPVLLLPSFITYALSTALVPAISEAAAQRQSLLIEHRLQQALRLSFVTGGLSIVVFYIFATPVMELMYGNSNAAIYVKVMAPFFIFYFFQGPLTATLQALDLAKAAMINSLFGNVIKIAAIFVLATRPSLGIMGLALAIVISMLLTTLLHLSTIIKVISYSFYVMDYVKCIFTMIFSGIAGNYVYNLIPAETSLALKTFLAICLTTAVYIICLFLFGLIKKNEMRRVPFIGESLASLLPK